MVSHTENVWEGAGIEMTWAAGIGVSGTRLLPNPPRTAANLSKVPYMAEDVEMGYVANDTVFIKPAGAPKDTVVPFVKGLKYQAFKRKQYFEPTNTGCMGLTFIQEMSDSRGYQEFGTTTDPSTALAQNYTFKLTLNGTSFNAGADITVGLLLNDPLATVATKIATAINAITVSSVTAEKNSITGRIRIRSVSTASGAAISITAPGAGDSIITLLGGIGSSISHSAGQTPQSYLWHWDSPDLGDFDVRGCVLMDYLLEVKPDEFPYETLEFLYYDVTTSYYQSTDVDYDANHPITWDDFSITVDSDAVEFLSMSYHVHRNMNDERVGGRFQRAQPYVISVDTDVKLKFRTDSADLLGDFKPVPGYHEVNVGGAKAGASATGLTNGGSPYYYKVSINGAAAVEYNITVLAGVGNDVYTVVIALMNAATPGVQWSLVGGNLRATCAISTGKVVLTAGSSGTDLFASLTTYSGPLGSGVAPSQAIQVQSIIITLVSNPAIANNTITLANMTVDPEDLTINKLPGEMSLFEYDVTLKKGGASTIVWATVNLGGLDYGR